jgi:hypothetical protein
MHKKSLEAAEALKSSDENSDKEDEEKTENSDTSSSQNQRKTPIKSLNASKPPPPIPAKSNDSPPSSSISPVTMSPPITNHSSTTPNQQQQKADDASKKEFNLHSSPTTRTPTSYHLNPQEVQNNVQHASPLSHHTAMSAHHYPLNPINPTPDTDAEVFRWVNYNRDYPVSFIR